MKLVGALVCAATLLCVAASPLVNDDQGASPRAAGCTFHPKCDSTGEEKVPIPCEGFCDRYFFCQNGNPTMKECGRNLIGMKLYFNNHNRQCEATFNDCDWWNSDKTTTPTPDPSNPTGTADPSGPTTASPPDGSTSDATPTAAPTTEGPCIYNADCDATGTQKKPIPCAGFCNRYYLCVEGTPTVKTCDTFQNFNNVTRECSITFKDCNWYKAFQTTTQQQTDTPTSPTVTGSTQGPTTSNPNPTTTKPSRASSIVYSTTSLIVAVLTPLLARYI